MIERGISTYLETVYFVPTFPQFADWEAKSEQEKLLGTQFFCWPENLKKRRQHRILVVHWQQMTWTKHLNAGSDEDGRNPAITKQAACMRGCCKRRNNKRLVPKAWYIVCYIGVNRSCGWLAWSNCSLFSLTQFFPNISYLECSKQLWKRPCEFLHQLGFCCFVGTLQKMLEKETQENFAGSLRYVVLTKAIRWSYALRGLYLVIIKDISAVMY